MAPITRRFDPSDIEEIDFLDDFDTGGAACGTTMKIGRCFKRPSR